MVWQYRSVNHRNREEILARRIGRSTRLLSWNVPTVMSLSKVIGCVRLADIMDKRKSLKSRRSRKTDEIRLTKVKRFF